MEHWLSWADLIETDDTVTRGSSHLLGFTGRIRLIPTRIGAVDPINQREGIPDAVHTHPRTNASLISDLPAPLPALWSGDVLSPHAGPTNSPEKRHAASDVSPWNNIVLLNHNIPTLYLHFHCWEPKVPPEWWFRNSVRRLPRPTSPRKNLSRPRTKNTPRNTLHFNGGTRITRCVRRRLSSPVSYFPLTLKIDICASSRLVSYHLANKNTSCSSRHGERKRFPRFDFFAFFFFLFLLFPFSHLHLSPSSEHII